MEDIIIAIIGIAFVLFLFRLDAKRTKLSYPSIEPRKRNNNIYSQDDILNALAESHYRDFNNYKAYLESDEWKAKRKERLEIDKYTCQECQTALYDDTAHVHHITYDSLYNEDMNDLVSLCHKCHVDIHLNQTNRRKQ